MNPATSKAKWKKNDLPKGMARSGAEPEDFYHHTPPSRPKEKPGKRKFKIQREIDDYLLSLH
jgi:hypothetical protein